MAGSTVDRRLATWVEFVGELLQAPLRRLPHEAICNQLYDTFEVSCAAWTGCEDGATTLAFDEHFAPDVGDELFAEWRSPANLARHPVSHWARVTGSLAPQSIRRVPETIAHPRDRGHIHDLLRPVRSEEQLVITYRYSATSVGAFVVARGDSDFSDEDLEVARRLQALLVGLDRQTAVTGRHLTTSPGTLCAAVAVGLTPREAAVLALLAEGRTAAAIARRLGVSPRTVHQHLQRIYRKLKVNDRLSAVVSATHLGLLPSAGTTSPARAGDGVAPSTGRPS